MKTIIKKTIALTLVLIMSLSVIGQKDFSVSAAPKAVTTSIKKSPTIKKSNIRANSVKLKWNKVKGATSYKVYRSTNKKKWKLIKTLKANTLTVKKLKANKKYYFRVRAFKNKAKSPYSKIVTVKTKKAVQSGTANTPAKVTTALHSANTTTIPADFHTTVPTKTPLTIPTATTVPAKDNQSSIVTESATTTSPITETTTSVVATTVPDYSDDWEDGTEVKLYHRQSLPYTQGDITITNMKITKEHYNQVNEYGNYYPYKYTILIEGKAPAGTDGINVEIVFSDLPGINFRNPIYQSSFDDDGNFSCTSTYLQFHDSDIFFISRINKSVY